MKGREIVAWLLVSVLFFFLVFALTRIGQLHTELVEPKKSSLGSSPPEPRVSPPKAEEKAEVREENGNGNEESTVAS